MTLLPEELPEWLQRELDEARAADTREVVVFLAVVAVGIAAVVGAIIGAVWMADRMGWW
jgi:hypothetical protein